MEALRVLIVDDEQDEFTTLGNLLRKAGAEVRGASGGLQVPKAVAEFGPDAVLLDLALPDHSGLDVARELRQCFGGFCPVLICVTGRAGAADRDNALRSGFQHFVAKPYDPEALVKLVFSVQVPKRRLTSVSS